MDPEAEVHSPVEHALDRSPVEFHRESGEDEESSKPSLCLESGGTGPQNGGFTGPLGS